MLVIQRKQRLSVLRQTKKPAFLGGPFNRSTLRRELLAPFPVYQFAFIVIGFIANRIPAFVAIKIEIAAGFHPPPQLLAGRVMSGFARALEDIVTYIQTVTHLYEIL